ncbi:hypothetical protein [Intestinibacillus massiliensis]|uniref:hypothetical protein n=1 Tax=Intestinibacillus massiliensis TaxID=1871029 RepID=UPI000B34BE5A|nr:hypothetical protein [Intestinibacillus massiliensis]
MRLQFHAAELLLFQPVQSLPGLADFPVARGVHGKKITVADLSGSIVAEQLALLLLGKLYFLWSASNCNTTPLSSFPSERYKAIILFAVTENTGNGKVFK